MEVKYPKMIHTDLDAFGQDLFQVKKFRAMGPWEIPLFYLTDLVLIRICGWKENISFIQARFIFASMPMSSSFIAMVALCLVKMSVKV